MENRKTISSVAGKTRMGSCFPKQDQSRPDRLWPQSTGVGPVVHTLGNEEAMEAPPSAASHQKPSNPVTHNSSQEPMSPERAARTTRRGCSCSGGRSHTRTITWKGQHWPQAHHQSGSIILKPETPEPLVSAAPTPHSLCLWLPSQWEDSHAS